VVSSLAYPNLLGTKRLGCCCCCIHVEILNYAVAVPLSLPLKTPPPHCGPSYEG
jgi:hypothetical protein